ncbi:MAG: DNA-processing protein DprA [Candidatus Limnocylindrales bacterium]
MLGVQSLGPIVPRRVSESVPIRAAGIESASVSGAMQPEPHGSHQPSPGLPSVPGAAALQKQESDLERDAWVVLLSVSGLGPVSFGALLRAFGSARAVLEVAGGPGGPARLREALADVAVFPDGGWAPIVFDGCAPVGTEASPAGTTGARHRPVIGEELSARICEAAGNGASALEKVRSLGLTVVTLDDPDYPDRLRGVELPPPLLFVRGSPAALSVADAVAVVGTRWPTDKGRLIAGWIGSAIARTGAVVVSGLAVGIDGAAHAAVVGEGGRTVAVLGGGHARLFPKAHERLADAIVDAGGAIVSELTPETSPSRGTFPRRNRLISGLSDATVVVEAGRRSGALITAGWALEQGRECFLVPGPLDAPASAGCLGFLRSFPGQARVVCGVAELIEDLQLEFAAGGVPAPDVPARAGVAPTRGSAPLSSARGAGRAAVLASLGPVERSLAEELERGPATADQLSLRTALPDAAILSALTLLELRGLVVGSYGRYAPRGELARWSGASAAVSQGRRR